MRGAPRPGLDLLHRIIMELSDLVRMEQSRPSADRFTPPTEYPMRRLLATAALAFLVATPARAAFIVDQQSTAVNFTLVVGQVDASFGQSFTPTLDRISFVTATLSANASATYRVDLFAGQGFDLANRIGSSAASALAVGGDGDAANVQFDFASLISLIPQSVYTFRLVRESGSNTTLNGRVGSNNPYSRGALILPDGSASGGLDLTFSEGYDTALAAVPEPASVALMASSLPAGLLCWLRRRKAQAAA